MATVHEDSMIDTVLNAFTRKMEPALCLLGEPLYNGFAVVARCRRCTPVDDFRLVFAYTAIMSRYTKANHRVYMQFVRRDVWHVTFLEPGLQTQLPKTLTFADEGKIRELARRGEAWSDSESRQVLDYAIAKGEG